MQTSRLCKKTKRTVEKAHTLQGKEEEGEGKEKGKGGANGGDGGWTTTREGVRQWLGWRGGEVRK